MDGFRFDLASCLCRDSNGTPLEVPPIIRDIAKDPVLSKVTPFPDPNLHNDYFSCKMYMASSWGLCADQAVSRAVNQGRRVMHATKPKHETMNARLATSLSMSISTYDSVCTASTHHYLRLCSPALDSHQDH